MQEKFSKLKEILKNLDTRGICLAFSGGIDSTVLLFLCKDLNLTAVTFKSVFQTEKEILETTKLCNLYEVPQKIIEYHPLENEIIRNNPKDRCYHCKKLFFSKLKDFAGSRCIIDGTNADDLKVYRPGLKALKELDIISPLAESGITKIEIREFAKQNGIKTFDKPSTPCLATRFPYGTQLTEDLIKSVDEGEKFLKKTGFSSFRLRRHSDIARIEILPEEFGLCIKMKESITARLKELGFKYITLDIEGLRSGSMDI